MKCKIIRIIIKWYAAGSKWVVMIAEKAIF